jgi:uncharacterized protein
VPSSPVRTCVGCGVKAAPTELVRLKADGMRVIIDHQRSGGRGAWLHRSGICLERAIKRRVFARALRTDGVVADGAALRVELTGNPRKD